MLHLHHFTNRQQWPEIRSSGQLLLTHSRAHPTKLTRGVVWLTTADVVDDPVAMGLDVGIAKKFSNFADLDRTQIRITVEVSKTYTHRYREWATKHGGHPGWLKRLAQECGQFNTWWVHTKVIPREAWTEVRDMRSGATLSIAPTPQQLGFKKLRV